MRTSIASEMMERRRELIDLQAKQGGCAAIQLNADKVQFCYNPARKTTATNPAGEKFYVTGTMKGCPVLVNESDIYLD